MASLVVVVHLVAVVLQEDGKMAFLTENDKKRIADTIADIEQNTSGELVTVIAQSADNYLYIPTLMAALLALITPAVIGLTGHHWAIANSYLLQVSVFVLLVILFRLPPLTMWLIPTAVKRQRAHRVAMEQFFAQNLHHTEERNGVLLFVSLAEHYVEIIADKGINDKVSADAWQGIVDQFVSEVKAGNPTDGFIGAAQASGELLKKYFPATGENKNELVNGLVEL